MATKLNAILPIKKHTGMIVSPMDVTSYCCSCIYIDRENVTCTCGVHLDSTLTFDQHHRQAVSSWWLFESYLISRIFLLFEAFIFLQFLQWSAPNVCKYLLILTVHMTFNIVDDCAIFRHIRVQNKQILI